MKRNPHPRALDLYQDFHEVEPRQREVDVPEPKGPLIKIGRLIELVYEPESPSRLKGKQFVHEMGDTGELFQRTMALRDKPILATDGKNLFILRGRSRYYFSERGIIG